MRIAWIPFGVLLLIESAVSFTDNDEGVSVELISHSFNSPFQYDPSSSNWFMSGATIPIKSYRSSLILNPHILRRHGYLLNTRPLLSDTFDITLTLHLDNGSNKPTGSPIPKDQFYSVWFSAADLSKEVQNVLKNQLKKDSPNYIDILDRSGFDPLTGLPRKYRGIGVMVKTVFHDKRPEAGPGVAIVTSDGRSNLNPHSARFAQLLPDMTGTGGYSDPATYRMHQLVYIRMKIKVYQNTIGVYIQERADWKLVSETKSDLIPSPRSGGGYFGMTSFTGTTEGSTPYRVRFTSLHVKSYDLNALNTEDNGTVVKMFTDQGLSIADLLSDDSFATKHSQTLVLRKLMNVIDSYIKQTVPSLKSFESTISTLQTKFNQIDSDIIDLSRETRLTFEKRSASSKERDTSGLTELLSQVKSIRTALNQAQSEKVHILSTIKYKTNRDDAGKGVERQVGYYQRQMDSRHSELNEAFDSQNRFTLILFLVVFLAALVMGVIFYIRLNAYARKAHIF